MCPADQGKFARSNFLGVTRQADDSPRIVGKRFGSKLMDASITEEAIKIIDSAPAHGPLRPADYRAALPARAAALARVLADHRISDAAEKYQLADMAAIRAQTTFARLGRTSAYAGFIAAVLGGFMLYLNPSNEALRSYVGLAQFVFLLISMFTALALFLFKPYRTWRTQRSAAEALRLQIFAYMMSGRAEAREMDAPLLPLQLECFRRHLLVDQRLFFARRGPQQYRTVLVWRTVGRPCNIARFERGPPAVGQTSTVWFAAGNVAKPHRLRTAGRKRICTGRPYRRRSPRPDRRPIGNLACGAECSNVQDHVHAARYLHRERTG